MMGVPQAIALVCATAPQGAAGGGGVAAQLLLDDFERALCAYERLSALHLDDADGYPAPHLARITLEPLGSKAEAGAGIPPTGADAVVVALACDADGAARIPRSLQEALGQVPLDSQAPVYLLAALRGKAEGISVPLLASAVRASCSHAGARWCGGLAVAHAELMGALMASPRLGMFRRPVSEPVDDLVAAVRMGLPLALRTGTRDEAAGARARREPAFKVAMASKAWLWLHRAG